MNMTFAASVDIAAVPPADFICPITHDIMRDPVMCRTGFNFEKAAILRWMRCQSNVCPLTRQPIEPRDLVSNHNLRGRIESWCYAYGITLDDQVIRNDEANTTSNETERSLSDDATALLTFTVAAVQKHAVAVAEMTPQATPPRQVARIKRIFSRRS